MGYGQNSEFYRFDDLDTTLTPIDTAGAKQVVFQVDVASPGALRVTNQTNPDTTQYMVVYNAGAQMDIPRPLVVDCPSERLYLRADGATTCICYVWVVK
tara:strand:+ start:281 stop:577 length:297 start_codon:yes stop_codon:yes gene_type:complete